jgi:hypothetical protein
MDELLVGATYDDAAERKHLAIRDEFLIDPDVVFLNHGSFGACPRTVFDWYQAWQRELERQPVEFLSRRVRGLPRRAWHWQTLLAPARTTWST